MEKRVGELESIPPPLEFLKSVIQESNDRVFQVARQMDLDMGTTLTVGLLVEKTLFIAHVGDSGVYQISKDSIKKITKDHSWVAEQVSQGKMTREEAKSSPQRSIITQFIGRQTLPKVALYEQSTQKKETYLFCSDGLSNYVEEDDIHRYVCKIRNLKRLSNKLIQLANGNGGEDNITVALLRLK